MKKLYLIFILTISCLCAEKQNVSEKFPVDITFVVLDLKYNQQQGVKICEVQTCSVSSFRRYYKLFGKTRPLSHQFSEVLSQYFTKIWVISSGIPFTRKSFNNSYSTIKDSTELFRNSSFLKKASLPVDDPYNLEHYHGIVYARKSDFDSLKQFQEDYPGIVLMDTAAPLSGDKYHWGLFFSNNGTLASIKPRWNVYETKYDKSLAESIINNLKCDLFVIKPIGAGGGRGVIIVNKNDLDKTLKTILNNAKTLRNNRDPSYSYWFRDRFNHRCTHFVIEEFIESDPLAFPNLDSPLYDPTMRLPVMLIYHQKKIQIKFMTGFWKLPKKALSERGSLNDQHKCHSKKYCEVSPEIRTAVEQQLREDLIPVYQQMLGIDE